MVFYIDLGVLLSDSNPIGGSIKLPRETLHDPLPVVIVNIEFGGSPAPFRHTLQQDQLK